ncbi:MAG: hypothetical protein CR988_07005 [Treponema sp.]|nr:MAG: hypothetical protein CR988_07005 [Treponema sp.]
MQKTGVKDKNAEIEKVRRVLQFTHFYIISFNLIWRMQSIFPFDLIFKKRWLFKKTPLILRSKGRKIMRHSRGGVSKTTGK